jgi:hypothetical protein
MNKKKLNKNQEKVKKKRKKRHVLFFASWRRCTSFSLLFFPAAPRRTRTCAVPCGWMSYVVPVAVLGARRGAAHHATGPARLKTPLLLVATLLAIWQL